MDRGNLRTIDQLGRIILPLSFRRILGWEPGDEIVVCLDEDSGIIKLELHKKGKKSVD